MFHEFKEKYFKEITNFKNFIMENTLKKQGKPLALSLYD